MRANIIERKGRIEDLDRSFDLKFWQAQEPQARFAATWELIVHAFAVKGNDVRQLRLHRSIETFQRQPLSSSETKTSTKQRVKRKSKKK